MTSNGGERAKQRLYVARARAHLSNMCVFHARARARRLMIRRGISANTHGMEEISEQIEKYVMSPSGGRGQFDVFIHMWGDIPNGHARGERFELQGAMMKVYRPVAARFDESHPVNEQLFGHLR